MKTRKNEAVKTLHHVIVCIDGLFFLRVPDITIKFVKSLGERGGEIKNFFLHELLANSHDAVDGIFNGFCTGMPY